MNKLNLSLTLVRVGVGLTMITSALYKIIEANEAAKRLAVIFMGPVSSTTTILLGCAQLLLGIFVVIALWRRFTYPIAAFAHLAAVLSTYRQLLDPLDPLFHLYMAHLALLVVFVFLCLHWREDKWLTVD